MLLLLVSLGWRVDVRVDVRMDVRMSVAVRMRAQTKTRPTRAGCWTGACACLCLLAETSLDTSACPLP